MSTCFEAKSPGAAPSPDGNVAAVMTSIGNEIAQWENGGQSGGRAQARIWALVKTGVDLIRAQGSQP